MDTTLFRTTTTKQKPLVMKTAAGAVERKFQRVGEVKRIAELTLRQQMIGEILELDPEADEADIRRWRPAELEDHLRRLDIAVDQSSLVSLPAENANDMITVADDGDVHTRTYRPSSLQNLPAEAFASVVITTTADLTREQLAHVVRIVKPNGKISIKGDK